MYAHVMFKYGSHRVISATVQGRCEKCQCDWEELAGLHAACDSQQNPQPWQAACLMFLQFGIAVLACVHDFTFVL